ncbi:Ras GTPase-activating-like protein iqgap2, partial [Coelomomyces lativittatus]
MLSFSDFSMDEADSTINQTHSELHNPKPSLPPLNLVDNEELEDVDESHVHEPKSPLSFTSSKCTNVNWMDEKRINKTAYEYLCRLEEAKQWLEECLDEALPPVSELGEYLRNGIVLAKVVKKYHPDLVKKIYD